MTDDPIIYRKLELALIACLATRIDSRDEIDGRALRDATAKTTVQLLVPV